MISSKQRSKLRSLAHHLKPNVIVGKSGVTKGVVESISESLDAHELIKVKFNASKQDKGDFISSAEDLLSAYIVGTIGHTIIIYRANEDREKRKYHI